MVIYKLTSPSGRVYIGQSSNIEGRLRKYKGHHCKKQKLLYASFVKYGFGNHFFEILHSGLSKKLANELERKEISKYKKRNISLNILDGGCFGGVNAFPVLQFDLNSNLIKKYSSIKEASIYNCVSDVAIGKAILNKTYYCCGFFWIKEMDYNENTIFKKGSGTVIYQYDINKLLINKYISSGEASLKTGFSQSAILRKAKSETDNFLKGYYWSDNESKKIYKDKNKRHHG